MHSDDASTAAAHDEAISTIFALDLCMTPAIEAEMTPTQQVVFMRLYRLQKQEGGPYSLLPNVMDALLELARQPWWDAGASNSNT